MGYADWNPSLDNGNISLQRVLDTLPGNSPAEISVLVQVLENPRSPFSLPGAVTLEVHDCVHALVGRGLLKQDEAFVIGYTMGNAKRLKYWHINLYKYYATYIFPKEYRFGKVQLIAFDLGLTYGMTRRTKDIHKVDLTEYKDKSMSELRAKYDINLDILKKLRYAEKHMFKTKASRRL